MAETQAVPGTRYKAFLSYSHKDAAAARWLHRRLESYRLPRRLAGKNGLHGPVPTRLTPIFRDREELPAAGDLSETVRAALAASENLIVICSPHAAASPWVGREIALFRALHPDRPVYAAIAHGEPAQAFPPELTAGGSIEPLAADLRGEGDGRRLGFLKLAAGLAGVGLDALVQRDAQRRIRRVTAVTAAALAAMLVMAVLTTMALTARAEAERQRAQAEGLVEFMLTDLRDRLHSVGRLDVLNAVNRRALDYYGGRPDFGTLDDDSLARRARVLHAIGDDALTQDDLDEAYLAYSEARSVTQAQVARSPGDPRRLLNHGKSEFGMGRIYELKKDWSRAYLHYSSFARATDQVLAADATNSDYMVKAAAAAIDIGNIQLNGQKDAVAAQASYEKAVDLLGRAAMMRSEDIHVRLSQANAYGWLADAFYAQRDWRGSLKARFEQLAIVEKLHKVHPKSAEITFRLAAANRGTAYSLLKSGDPGAARSHFFAAFARARLLVALDPRNAEWRQFSKRVGGDLLKLRLGLPPNISQRDLRQQAESSHESSAPS